MLKVHIFSLRTVKNKKVRESHPSGQITWSQGEVNMQIRNKQVLSKVRHHFDDPITVRKAVGLKEGQVGFHSVELQPGDKEHFLSALGRIRIYDLDYDIIPSKQESPPENAQ